MHGNGAQVPIPPTIIHKGEELNGLMCTDLPPDWVVGGSAKAYMTEEIFIEILQNFHRSLPSHIRPQYLLMDGYIFHFVPYLKILEEDGIHSIFGGSHTSIWAQVNEALAHVFVLVVIAHAGLYLKDMGTHPKTVASCLACCWLLPFTAIKGGMLLTSYG